MERNQFTYNQLPVQTQTLQKDSREEGVNLKVWTSEVLERIQIEDLKGQGGRRKKEH